MVRAKRSHAFVVLFDVNNPKSFDKAKKLIEHIRRYKPVFPP